MRRIVDDVEPGEQIGDLGNFEELADRRDGERDSLGTESVNDGREVGTLTAEHRNLAPGDAGCSTLLHHAHDPLCFGSLGCKPCRNDLPGTSTLDRGEGEGTLDERKLGTHGVGKIEDDSVRAAVLTERECLCSRSVASGEVVRERLEVLCGGTAPLIDRLVCVSYGGDWYLGREECREETSLGRVGVLVFIEHDGVVARADCCRDIE